MFYHHKHKSVAAALLCIAVTFGVMSFSSKQQPKHNFKILPQDIPADSLKNIMHGFNDALGVKCGFCHAQNAADTSKFDFASDAKKEKEYARHMMKMTTNINADYFNFAGSEQPDAIKTVTCMMCHRGNEKPEN